jgi:nucleotide-binding universal stress UspA family protein
MSRYRLLVPVDGNEERAAAQGDHVAGLPDAPETVAATLLYVYSTDTGDAGTERVGDHIGRPDSVEQVRSRLADDGIPVEIREEEGDVATTVLSVAAELAPDAIVMAGRKRSPVGKAVFGSVTQEVILNASSPVTVVR